MYIQLWDYLNCGLFFTQTGGVDVSVNDNFDKCLHLVDHTVVLY